MKIIYSKPKHYTKSIGQITWIYINQITILLFLSKQRHFGGFERGLNVTIVINL
jgi:hypothetical protein